MSNLLLGFGEEISRLTMAENHLNQTIQLISKYHLSPAFADGASAFLRTVSSTKQAAENDNRTVYLESIPSPSSLTDVIGLLMVKPLPIFDYDASLVAAGE